MVDEGERALLHVGGVDRLPLVRRLHVLRKDGVAPGADALVEVDDGRGVRVEEVGVDLRNTRGVAAALPLGVGQQLGAPRAARVEVPLAVGLAVVGDVARVLRKVGRRDERADGGHKPPEDAHLGDLRAAQSEGSEQ